MRMDSLASPGWWIGSLLLIAFLMAGTVRAGSATGVAAGISIYAGVESRGGACANRTDGPNCAIVGFRAGGSGREPFGSVIAAAA